MSVIRAVEIRDKKNKKTIRLFPDQQHLYWDAYTIQEGVGVYQYYQMHVSTVLDILYRAGASGMEAKIIYKGGDNVELQQQDLAAGAGEQRSSELGRVFKSETVVSVRN